MCVHVPGRTPLHAPVRDNSDIVLVEVSLALIKLMLHQRAAAGDDGHLQANHMPMMQFSVRMIDQVASNDLGLRKLGRAHTHLLLCGRSHIHQHHLG